MALISSFFRGCTTGGPSPATATGPGISTSIYQTRLGLTSLTWSRSLLGLSLNASVHLTPSSSDDYNNDSPLHFKIHPWLFWKRKGTRCFYFNIALQRRTVYIAWNLTRARFPTTGSPEPSSGFFIAVSVDREIVLVAGDMSVEAHRKMKVKQRPPTMLVSRREHVVLKGNDGRRMGSYQSTVRIGGTERQIGIEISGGMSVAVNGKKVLHVRRVRWKFRGSQQVEIDDGGGRILISWDLHTWFFPVKENPSPASAAIFVFCFEREEVENRNSCEKVVEITDVGGELEREWVSGFMGRNGNWSESSSYRRGGGGFERMKGRKKSLLKTCSSSSSFSSASSAASSSVMDWCSSEETEMRGVDGFTLVVYAWKN